MRSSVIRWMVVTAALGLAAACGGQKEEKVVIVHPTGAMVSHFPIYSEAGGLGGTSAEVDVGEFARIIERQTVGAGIRGASPGEWVKIRTVFNPREGWIKPEQTRPAPRD